MLSKQQARRRLLVFMLVLVATSAVSICLFRRIFGPSFSPRHIWIMLALFSYLPALAALIARVGFREGFKDVSFSLRGDWCLYAILIGGLWPVVCGLMTYGVAWLAGFTHFAPCTWDSSNCRGPENFVGISIEGMAPVAGFIVRLVACLFFSLAGCLLSFGQELGWRGYMLTRLFDAKIPAPIFWNGLVWGLWQVSFLLTLPSDQNPPERLYVSMVFFTAGAIAYSYLFSYLRMRSGSIWPVVLAHSTGIIVFFLLFNEFTDANVFWKGELYLLSVGLPVLVLMFIPRPWILRYWPQRGGLVTSLSLSADTESS
jgi:membrane protease YdiL (CAAX protease family)